MYKQHKISYIFKHKEDFEVRTFRVSTPDHFLILQNLPISHIRGNLMTYDLRQNILILEKVLNLPFFEEAK